MSTRPSSITGFVVPIIPSRIDEDVIQLVDRSESDLSTPPTVDTSVLRSSESSSADDSASQEWVLKDEEKRSFINAIYYFGSKMLDKSKSETAKNLKIILSISKKTNAKFFEGQEINADMLATAAMEIVAKNKIQYEISKIHPMATFFIRVSELVEVFRSPLQDAIKLEYDENRTRMADRTDWTNRIGHRDIWNDFLAYSYAAIEVGSWPDRLIAFYAKVTVATGKAGIGAYGEGWKEFVRDAVARKTPIFEARLIHQYLYTKMMDDPTRPLPRSETEEGGNYELYDQLTAEQEALDYALYEAETQNRKNPHSPLDNDKQSGGFTPPDLTAYQLPNPYKPHPITNTVGGSFSASGGSGVRMQATGQINVTVYGSKNLPSGSPAVKAAMVHEQSNSTSTGEGHGRGRHPESVLGPIRKALSAFEKSYANYKAKVDELQSVQNEGSSSPDGKTQTITTADGNSYESPDSIINRKEREILLANELVALTKDAMEKAWSVRQLTRAEAVRGNRGLCGGICHEINSGIKELLYNEFGVPQYNKLKKEHLHESTRVQTWSSVSTSAGQARKNAQMDKDILNTQREFNAADRLVVELESVTGPVDANRLAEALQPLKILGKQLAAQIRARGAGSPQEIDEKVQLIEDRIAALSSRDIRYIHILVGCKEFSELEASLLSKIEANGNEQEILDGLKKAADQKATLDIQIADLIAQAPGNTEKNNELLQFGDTVSAKFTNVSLAKQSKDVSRTYQQYREEEAAIREMENGDGPVDPLLRTEALTRLKALGDLLIAQVRIKADLSSTFSDADLNNYEKQIRGEIDALDRRDVRYDKIGSGYEDFCNLEKEVLPELIIPDNEQSASKGLSLAAQKKKLLEQQIADLTAECPGNAEKNARLTFIQKDIEARFSALAFCGKSHDDKTAELHRLRDQIGAAASPAERSDVISAYQRRASFFSLQLATCKNYKGFSTNFNDFVNVLSGEESVGELSIEILNDMIHDLMAGIVEQKIDPETSIPCLEAFEKKHSSGTSDLTQIRLTIGGLFCCTDRSKTQDAMQWYQKCQSLQPNNPLWPRRQALCLLETLHYSEAENTILKALEIDPSNEDSKNAAAAIVKDKYQNASLALEWLQLGIQGLIPEENDTVSKLRGYTSALKAAHGILSVASHPTVLKRTLSHLNLLLLPEDLKRVLIEILEKDKTAHFTWFNATTLATRAISAATGVIMSAYPKDQYPNLHRRAAQLTGISGVVQMPLSFYQTYSSLSKLWTKYNKKKLTLFSSLRGGVVGMLIPLSTAIPFVQSFFYKDKEAKLISQRSRPVLHSVIETLASKQFASAVILTDLAWRSSSFIGKIPSRFTPKLQSKVVERMISAAALVFLVWQAGEAYIKANDEIMGRPVRPNTVVSGYLNSWWNYFKG